LDQYYQQGLIVFSFLTEAIDSPVKIDSSIVRLFASIILKSADTLSPDSNSSNLTGTNFVDNLTGNSGVNIINGLYQKLIMKLLMIY
jgi:hypothetical protein